MTTGKIIEIILAEAIAVVMFVFAYAIGVRHKMELIAGYNQRTAPYVTDKPALARLVGRLCLLVGLATAVMPLVTAIWGKTLKGWSMSVGHYGGFILGALALVILQSREYVSTRRGGP